MSAKILVVDDEKSIRVTARAFLEELGYEVQTAEDAMVALEMLEESDYDVVLTDIIMPKITGVELLNRILSIAPRTEVILITGEPTINTATEAVRAGATDYLAKPITKHVIQKVVTHAVRLKQAADDLLRLRAENRAYQENLEEIVEDRTRSLVDSELRYRRLFDNSLDMIYVLDTDGKFVDVNLTMSEALGYDKLHFIGLRFEDIVDPKTKDHAIAQLKRGLKGETLRDYQMRLISSDGTIVYVRAELVPFEEDGKVVSIHGSLININKRKEAEEALAAERNLLHKLTDYIPDAIYFKDLQGRFIQMNQAQARLFNLDDPNQAVGMSDFDFFPEDRATEKFEDEKAIIKSGQPIIDKEESEILPNGQQRWVSTTKMPLRGLSGEIEGTFGVSRDITDRKQLERNLSNALEKALDASRLKSEFISTMSHEIRTPMNGVIGMTEILIGSDLNEDQLESAEAIRNCGDELMTLINEILDFSKIVTGKLELKLAAFSLNDMLDEIFLVMAPLARNKRIDLQKFVDPRLLKQMYGDPRRIRQVLTCLMSNAIKFTNNGSIEVKVEPVDSTDDSKLRIAFTDTGIGISEEDQPRIFQAFTQADGSDSRRYGGTGIGLAISRQLMELMGGSIGFESELGKGSTFWIEIELPAVDPSAQADSSDESAGSLSAGVFHLLIIDDNTLSQRVAEVLLDMMGYKVDVASGGSAAIEMLNEKAYDGIFMDIQMPLMSGYETTHLIRSGGVLESNKDIPIIALTACGFTEDRQKCIAAGMNEYLTKPISLPDLREALENSGLMTGISTEFLDEVGN